MKRLQSTYRLPVFMAGLCLCGIAQAAKPEIEFTHIPAYRTFDRLKGQVKGGDPAGYSVAVYIYVSGWWTKPTAAAPLTSIRSDGSWECNVTTGSGDHMATRFAAFLVPSDYTPPAASGAKELPDELNKKADAQVIASRPAGRQFEFSGCRWWIKDSSGAQVGPGPNFFSGSDNNVWVDDDGRLHLKITKAGEKWQCAEVVSLRSFGYGTYRVYLDTPPQEIDHHAILGFFTWSDAPEYTHREIDVEISKWSDPKDRDNAQFVVQPWEKSGNRKRFSIPEDQSETTHSFEWSAKKVLFASYANHYELRSAVNKTIKTWSYSGSGVPKAGDENFRINLWLNEGKAPSDRKEIEVVISRFEFVPLKQ